MTSRWTATPRMCSTPSARFNSHHTRRIDMAIKIGDKLPEGSLTEMIEQETPGCTIGPNNFSISDLTKGKRVVIFGVPGAFTPTCSAKHVPSYVAGHDRLKSKKVDEVWCVS